MRLLVLFAALFLALPVRALKLSYIGESSLPYGEKFKNSVIGGLSGISFHEDKLFALSDDRGRLSDERFYKFSLGVKKSTVTLKPEEVYFLKNLPKTADGKKAGLDPEGLARLPDGTFVISSEGTNDAKPRVMPRIFQVDGQGKWLLDLPIPNKFLPEETGKQTKGIQNNLAFEGLAALPDGKTVFAAVEKALLQDVLINEEDKGDFIRIIKFTKLDDGFKVAAEYTYRIDPLLLSDVPKEIFRGVSEILAVSDTRILVMERGAKISPQNLWTSTVALYLVDLSKATDVSSMEKLDTKKITSATKNKIIDFEVDLKDKRKGKIVDNFEALSWGPTLPDGRKTLLVMSDNNFSKTQMTELLVFAVEEE